MPGYSADDGYSAVYELKNNSDSISITTTGVGTLHTVSKAPAQSASYPTGVYDWQLYVVKGAGPDERHFIDEGQIEVIGYTTGAQDQRSRVKRTLDAIDAALEAKASGGDVQEYSIDTGNGSRSMKKMTFDELLKARGTFAALYRIEMSRKQGRKSIILPKFSNNNSRSGR